MNDGKSLSHGRWEYKYHEVWIPISSLGEVNMV